MKKTLFRSALPATLPVARGLPWQKEERNPDDILDVALIGGGTMSVDAGHLA